MDYVASMNLRRRDLDGTQRAFIGIAYKKEAEPAARLRSLATQNNKSAAAVELDPAHITPGRARDLAGAKAGVSGRYIDRAEQVSLLAPDLVSECRAGNLPITQALAIIAKRQAASPGAYGKTAAYQYAPACYLIRGAY